MVARGGGGFQVVIDPGEWFRLKTELDKFDPALMRALRKRIRNAGQTAADKVKETLGMPSPDGGPDNTGGREALAAATKVSLSFSSRSAGAKITTGSGRLSAEHKGLLNVYNKETFRHPVYGNQNAWVEQQGRPYFGKVIQPLVNKEMLKEIRAALDDATRAIGGVAL